MNCECVLFECLCCGDVIVNGIVVQVLCVIGIVVEDEGVEGVCDEIVGEAISISMPDDAIISIP